jgi:hypothetical protein
MRRLREQQALADQASGWCRLLHRRGPPGSACLPALLVPRCSCSRRPSVSAAAQLHFPCLHVTGTSHN